MTEHNATAGRILHTYDLLLKGGMVIDPEQGLHAAMDVAIADGRIARISKVIDGRNASRVLNVHGCLVTPGLVDLHTHVYPGANQFGVNADFLARTSGVTTFVDAGSAGPVNFVAFKEHVIDRSLTRILVFLNIAWGGLSNAIYRRSEALVCGELTELRYAVVSAAVEIGSLFPHTIKGIKVRLGLDACGTQGIAPLRLALEAADQLNKPVMVHLSYPPPTRREVVPLLREGDILTHVFRGDPNSALNGRGQLMRVMMEARDRGVIMDVGHGGGSFSLAVAAKLLKAGFYPDVISSDIHLLCQDLVVDLPTTMSKMMALGMNLDKVIEATTITPARILGIDDEIGRLKQGAIADVAVFSLERGCYPLKDGFGGVVHAEKLLKAVCTIQGGTIIGNSLSTE